MPVATTSVTLSGTWDSNPCGDGSVNEVEWFTSGEITVNGSSSGIQQVDTAADCSASESFNIADASAGDSIEFDYYANNERGFLITLNVVEPEPEPAPEPEPEPVIEQPPNTPSMSWTFQTTDSLGGPVTVRASWIAPTITEAQPVTQYQATISGDRGATRTCTTPATSCTVGNLPRGQLYTVSVRAINGAGWSSPSGATQAIIAPEPPGLSNLRAEPVGVTTRVYADITPPVDDAGWFVQGYDCRVTNMDNGQTLERRAEQHDGGWRCNLWDLGGRELQGSPVKVEARTLLSLTAVSTAARILTSGWTSEEFYVPGAPTKPEIQTLRASANKETAGIAVIWQASKADTRGGDSIVGYTVRARGESYRFPDATCETDGVTGCGLVGLDPRGSYSVSVKARTALGQEVLSDAKVIDFPALKPGQVSDVVWKDSLNRPTVWWSLPENSSAAPITGQQVEIRRGGRWVPIEPGQRGLREVGANRYRFDDRGTKWRARVRVTSTVGAGEWTELEPTKMTAEPTLETKSRVGSMILTFGDCEPNQRIVYRYRLSSAPEWVEQETTCKQIATLSNLDPGNYEIQAAAEGVLGRSQYVTDAAQVWAPMAKPKDLSVEYRHRDSKILAGWSSSDDGFAAPPDYLEAELWACGRAFSRIKGKTTWPADGSRKVRFNAPSCVEGGDQITLAVRSARGDETSDWSAQTEAVPFWKPDRRPVVYLDNRRFFYHELDVQIGKSYCTGSGRFCGALLGRPDSGESQSVNPPLLPKSVNEDDLRYELELRSERTGETALFLIEPDGSVVPDLQRSGFDGFDIRPSVVRQSDSKISVNLADVIHGLYKARARLVYTPETGAVITSPWSKWSNTKAAYLKDPEVITADMVRHIDGFGVDVFRFLIPQETMLGLDRLDLLVSSTSQTDPFSKSITLDANTDPFLGGFTRLENGDYFAVYNYYTGLRNFEQFEIQVTPYIGGRQFYNRDQYPIYVSSR